MDLNKWNKILIIASICLSILSYIRCDPVGNVNIDVTTPCKDVAEGINRVYMALKDRMPLEARCRRYAVFLSMADTAGATNELALLQLSLMKEEILDWLYDEINIADLAVRYMTAIDVYRAIRLDPAFIDLIECLRHVPMSTVKTYLDDPELKMIEVLYRRAVASPAGAIELDSVDLSALNPEFRATLEKLFEGHSDTLNENSGQIDIFNQLSLSYEPRKLQAEQFIQELEERVRRISMKRKRQTKFRQRHLERLREIDRDRKRQKKKESVRQQHPSNEQPRRQDLPITIEDRRLKKLARDWHLKQEAQRRYRERNRERLRAQERDRRLQQKMVRQKMLQQRNLPMRSRAATVTTSVSESESNRHQQPQERRQGQSEALLPPPDQSASTSAPTLPVLESSVEQLKGLAPLFDVQPEEQVSEQQQWLERLEKLNKTRSRTRERKREYRVLNPQLVREREREWKRKWRQKVRARQQKQSASTSRMLNLSLTGQRVDGANVQPADQVLEQHLWREIIDKSESAARRRREREREYRKQNPQVIRAREREHKRRWRQRRRERQQEEVDQLLEELDGSGKSADPSDSEQEDQQQ